LDANSKGEKKAFNKEFYARENKADAEIGKISASRDAQVDVTDENGALTETFKDLLDVAFQLNEFEGTQWGWNGRVLQKARENGEEGEIVVQLAAEAFHGGDGATEIMTFTGEVARKMALYIDTNSDDQGSLDDPEVVLNYGDGSDLVKDIKSGAIDLEDTDSKFWSEDVSQMYDLNSRVDLKDQKESATIQEFNADDDGDGTREKSEQDELQHMDIGWPIPRDVIDPGVEAGSQFRDKATKLVNGEIKAFVDAAVEDLQHQELHVPTDVGAINPQHTAIVETFDDPGKHTSVKEYYKEGGADHDDAFRTLFADDDTVVVMTTNNSRGDNLYSDIMIVHGEDVAEALEPSTVAQEDLSDSNLWNSVWKSLADNNVVGDDYGYSIPGKPGGNGDSFITNGDGNKGDDIFLFADYGERAHTFRLDSRDGNEDGTRGTRVGYDDIDDLAQFLNSKGDIDGNESGASFNEETNSTILVVDDGSHHDPLTIVLYGEGDLLA